MKKGYKETEEDYSKKFGKNLCSLREQEGLTQKQFADMLCVAVSTYANWEQGRREPDLYYLMMLAHHLKIDMNTLFDIH